MASKLRPLQLPLLVERQKLEDAQDAQFDLDDDHYYMTSVAAEALSPDVSTPATPNFSRGHLRCSSSSSSFDLSTPATSEGPSSPTQLSQKAGTGKWALPDVQEEPLEPRFPDCDDCDDCDSYYNSDDCASDHFDLYNCLCKSCDWPALFTMVTNTYAQVTSHAFTKTQIWSRVPLISCTRLLVASTMILVFSVTATSTLPSGSRRSAKAAPSPRSVA